MTASEEQPELISPDPPVSSVHLEAVDSPRKAYYSVEVFVLPGGAGCRVQKASGGQKAKPALENYWCPGLGQALQKQAALVAAKVNKKKGRIYKEVAQEE